jgi:hypothetical protein
VTSDRWVRSVVERDYRLEVTAPPPLFSRHKGYSYSKGEGQKGGPPQGSRCFGIQGGCSQGKIGRSRSGFYLTFLLTPKIWVVTSDYKPQVPHPVHKAPAVPYGIAHSDSRRPTAGGLGSHLGSQGRLPACSGPSVIQNIAQVLRSRRPYRVQGSSHRSIHVSSCIYTGRQDGGRVPLRPRGITLYIIWTTF